MKRKVAIFAAKVALGMLLCAAPWPGLRHGFAKTVSEIANAMFEDVRFGGQGRLTLTAVEATPATVHAMGFDYDCVLELSVPGRPSLPFGMSMRKDLFLPVGWFLTLSLAAPTVTRQKLKACLLGLPLLGSLWLCLIGLTALWGFSSMNGVFDFEPSTLTIIDTCVAVLLVPPSHRFVIPLLLAAGFAFSAQPRGVNRARTADQTAPA